MQLNDLQVKHLHPPLLIVINYAYLKDFLERIH